MFDAEKFKNALIFVPSFSTVTLYCNLHTFLTIDSVIFMFSTPPPRDQTHLNHGIDISVN